MASGVSVLEIHFATSNKNKYAEAREILAKGGISVLPGKTDCRAAMRPAIALHHFPFRHNEIRSDSLEEIALDAVHAAYAELKKPVFVEDAGLFIDALNGFPGTYSAWVQKKLGVPGILRLMEGETNRSARFGAAIAFTDGKAVETFVGECPGRIAPEARGTSGFGYDPIFAPEGHEQTFAESISLKSELSHRYKSLLRLLEYLKGRNKHG